MNHDYLLPARRLGREAGYSVLSGFGLSLGLTVFLILGVILRHELSYDCFHERDEDVYRVAQSRLFVACINYGNLATARSAIRAREVGVRKALRA